MIIGDLLVAVHSFLFTYRTEYFIATINRYGLLSC
jgi:hypothetical protein